MQAAFMRAGFDRLILGKGKVAVTDGKKVSSNFLDEKMQVILDAGPYGAARQGRIGGNGNAEALKFHTCFRTIYKIQRHNKNPYVLKLPIFQCKNTLHKGASIL